MAFPKIKISDDSGNAVGVTDNRLNVNAYLNATPTIDIGDVSLLFDGAAASTGAGATDSETQRVTLASNDVVLVAANSLLSTIGTNTTGVNTAIKLEDAGHSSGDAGIHILGVRDVSLDTSNPDSDGDYSSLLTNEWGALWTALDITTITTLMATGNAAASSTNRGYNMLAVRNDALANLVSDDGDYTSLQVNADGALYVDGSDHTQPVSGTITANLSATDNAVLDSIDADTSAIKISTGLLDNAISGNEMQVDVVAALPAGTNAIGKLSANSGVDIGDVDVTSVVAGVGATNIGKAMQASQSSTDTGVASLAVRKDTLTDLAGGNTAYTPLQVSSSGALYVTHGMKAMVSEVNDDVGTGAEDLRPAGDMACRRVDMMASPANTGYIWVGDSTVANDGTGGGIRLGPGDFYSVDVNAVNDIHVAATVNGEDIMYTYHT